LISESILQGARVRLRPPQERDLPDFIRWFNDPEVRYWLAMSDSPELTMEKEREWFEGLRADRARVVWCIEAEGKAIGTLGLHEIDETQGRATLGISIGEKECWGRGYGRDAIRQALAYGFGELELRRIDLNTDEDNERGVRCYEACGFQREGLLRAYRVRLGEPVNGLVMSVLREEFEGQP
jgi:RimJ/RimL family protein N-acetyltransferase